MKVSLIVVHALEIGLEISVAIVSSIHTSQQMKQYKGLMLNIFYIGKKNQQKSYNLDSYGHNK